MNSEKTLPVGSVVISANDSRNEALPVGIVQEKGQNHTNIRNNKGTKRFILVFFVVGLLLLISFLLSNKEKEK
eukprot:snap_masked-scaffold_21-processed-gene-3.26-mRNA-1 protein AED:1.00 eAED:1.00 QI:0/-1/0/0/-1/1/1/0/72